MVLTAIFNPFYLFCGHYSVELTSIQLGKKKVVCQCCLNRDVDSKDRKKVHRFPVPALLIHVISITSVKTDTLK